MSRNNKGNITAINVDNKNVGKDTKKDTNKDTIKNDTKDVQEQNSGLKRISSRLTNTNIIRRMFGF